MGYKRLKKKRYRGRKRGDVFKDDKTLFGPPRYKYLADIVKLDTPQNARESARILGENFGRAKTRAKKLRIKRATVQAANRARVMERNPKLSSWEHKQAGDIAMYYEEAYEEMVLPPKHNPSANKVKLSKQQDKAIKLMKDGWELGCSETSGKCWLQKGGLGSGGNTEKVKESTISALEKKGLITYNKRDYPFHKWKLKG